MALVCAHLCLKWVDSGVQREQPPHGHQESSCGSPEAMLQMEGPVSVKT